MPDLHILENDLEAFSQKLSDLSATINNIASLPYNLSYVKLAMEGGSAPTQATYAGEHMEDQLLALKTSLLQPWPTTLGLGHRVLGNRRHQPAVNPTGHGELPEPCPPVGPSKGE